MTSRGTWSMAAVLAIGISGAALAATGGEQTTTPTSPTMSTPNTLTHDGSTSLGTKPNGSASNNERQRAMAGPTPPPGAGTDIKHPRATDRSCGGAAC